MAAARLLSEKVRAEGYRTDLAGVGNSNLAAWLSGYEMKVAGVDVEITETGMVGYLPRPAEPFVFSFRNFPSCKMLTHTMGIFMGGGQKGPERPLVQAARERCGWDLAVAPSLRRFEPPTSDELRLIRMLDPRRYFFGPA